MNLLGDIVAPERRSDELAYERPGERAQSYSYSAFCTDAWKAGNLMRHYGVREGATVGIVDGPKQPTDSQDREGTPALPALVGFFGAALLGADVRFDPPTEPDVRALIAPTAWLEAYDLPPGSKALGFGANPEDPTVAQFERELWSENPIPFPSEFGPETTALQTETETFDHATLLASAEAIVAEFDLTAEDAVAVDASLASPGTVVAGVLAPLVAGGTVTVGGNSETAQDAALVVSETAEGENVLRPADVLDYSPGRT
jgi:hypothetical protein